MEIRQLRTFQVVASLLSFSKAAKVLHYAQSSISAQIKALEDDLGVQLFDRLEKKVVLTDAGQKLLQYAKRIVDLTEETRSELTNEKGLTAHFNLRVPESMSTYRFVPILSQFHDEYPQARITLSNCVYHELKNELSKGVYDLGFLYTDTFLAKDLQAEMLGMEQLCIVASADHSLAKRKSIKEKDLENEKILLSKTECSYRILFQQLLTEAKVVPKNIMEVNNVSTIKKLVAAGMGITIIPRISVTEQLKRNDLVELSMKQKEIEIQMLMIWYKDKWLSPPLKRLMELCVNVFNA